jgi:starch synthase
MYSLRYGTILLWEKTGGLKDTVMILEITATELSWSSSVGDICYSIQRAIKYKDKEHLNAIQNTGMNTDHSWEKACQEYIEVYNLIINKIWKLRRKML